MQINDNCINCGACQLECPAKAIFKYNSQYKIASVSYPPLSKKTYYIVNDLCTKCKGVSKSFLCLDICPMNAIS